MSETNCNNRLVLCPFCGWKEPKYQKNRDMWEGMLHEIHCFGCDTVMSDYIEVSHD